ncbi:heme exporter protein CcmD [Candidatus Pelagibacter sp.]|uniref:heme exporter protein CcmD n=1 Tax=Candidatus Pelagibacter sp. TaxID=2024849 RepID=UPI003F840E52
MINELLLMNGYAVYVLSAFSFTLLSFLGLYLVTKLQFVREQNKFITKFGTLTTEQANTAKSQRINKEILANVTNN